MGTKYFHFQNRIRVLIINHLLRASVGGKFDSIVISKYNQYISCRNVDTNANGAIDFNEFIDMMVKRRDCLDDDVAHAFKVFDRDGDGLISEEELRLTMTNLGEPLTEAEVRSMIAEADLDGDGKINFQEFSRLMAHNNTSSGSSGPSQSKGV